MDGWTGKGAITRELSAALDRFAETDGVVFPKDLAVLVLGVSVVNDRVEYSTTEALRTH